MNNASIGHLLLVALGSFVGISLCCFALSRRGGAASSSKRSRDVGVSLPAAMLLALSLLCLVAPFALAVFDPAHSLTVASRSNLANLCALLQPSFLATAISAHFLSAPKGTRRPAFVWLDSALLSLSLSLLVWWLWLEPLLGSSGRGDAVLTRHAFLLLFHLAALVFVSGCSVDVVLWQSPTLRRRIAVSVAASTRGEQNATETVVLSQNNAFPAAPGRLALLVALALLSVGFSLLLTRDDLTLAPAGVLAAAQILLGASACLAWNTPSQQENAGAPSSSATRDEATAPTLEETGLGGIYNLTVVVLPCLTIAVGVAHLSPATRPGSHATTAEAVLLYVLLFATCLRQATLGARNRVLAQKMLHEGRRLRAEVARRTHQLSTVHAVAADLNNSLNRELVLSTALDRMIEASGADAGAVWLRAEYDNQPDPAENGGRLAGGHGNNLEIGFGAPLSASDASMSETEAFEEQLEAARLEEQSASTRAADGESEKRSAKRRSGAKSADPTLALQRADARWVLVRASGQERDAQRHALEKMGEALEAGGLTRCAQMCADDAATFGASHVAPIRWSGKLMGVAGVLRWQEDFDESERALVQSIAIEAGAALQNAYLYQEARRRADLDGVTDLFNHRTMQEKLNHELNRARKGKTTLTIVMMDLNNFKFFNDTYGHPVGDGVLRKVAQCLRDTCRADDVLGRYGGDEFIALLTDTDARGALEVCARIAARVEENAYIEVEGRRIPISLSFGAAVYPHDGDMALELLTLADANLYEAKRGGAPLMIQRNSAEETQELRQLKNAGVGGSFGVLDALVTAIDHKDHYTRRHSEDVTHWASLMARQLGYSTDVQRSVRICGLLHDVGKIAVPDAILRKPGRLNDDEFNIMQQHPVFGALIVKDVPNLEEVLGGIRHHHERFDGKGYPDKLGGEGIPFMGRLLAVPDCFSAMTTDRPYRKALTWGEALEEIERGKGTQFDPAMADSFLEIISSIISQRNARVLDRDGARNSVVQITNIDTENDGDSMPPRSVADAVASGSPQTTVTL